MRAVRPALALLCLLAAPASATDPSGERLYAQHCLTCHQPGGEGVPGLYPPVADSAFVTGEPEKLISFMLQGSAARPQSDYGGAMPGFADLSNAALAALLTYIRSDFGNDASPVGAEQVAAVRAE